jgi:hypothetical protein
LNKREREIVITAASLSTAITAAAVKLVAFRLVAAIALKAVSNSNKSSNYSST